MKRTVCPVCGEFEFAPPKDDWFPTKESYENGEEYCSVCGWIYDENQLHDHNLKQGFNKLSVNECKKEFKEKRKLNPEYDYLDEHAPAPAPHKCPVCGEYEFEDERCHDICPICGWEDDGWLDDPMANKTTAAEARVIFKQKRLIDPNYTWEAQFADPKKK